MSPELRRISYIVVALVALVLAAFNVITAENAESIITSAGLLLGAGGLGLAAAKVGEAPDAKTIEQRIGDAVEYGAGLALERLTERYRELGLVQRPDTEPVTVSLPKASPSTPTLNVEAHHDPSFVVQPRTTL